MNPDRLSNVPLAKTAQNTFGIFSLLQGDENSTEDRIAAIVCAAYLVARRYGVNPLRLHELANNIVNGADGKQVPEFAGASRYLREEM